VTFVLVDRNAIHDNDGDGGDRAPLVVHTTPDKCSSAHQLVVRDRAGQVVGRFVSQSSNRAVNGQRPHVWFELEAGTIELVTFK